jgi:hypothetical protein
LIESDKIPYWAVSSRCRNDLAAIERELELSPGSVAAIDGYKASLSDYESKLKHSPVPVNQETKDAASRCIDSLHRLIVMLRTEPE